MPGQERLVDPDPADAAMVAGVGVQRLLLGAEGVEQGERRPAVDVLVVPREQELDRDGDPSRRLDQRLVHDEPAAEDGRRDPGFDRRERYPDGGAQRYAAAVPDRRLGTDFGQSLKGVQGRPPFRYGTLRQGGDVADADRPEALGVAGRLRLPEFGAGLLVRCGTRAVAVAGRIDGDN